VKGERNDPHFMLNPFHDTLFLFVPVLLFCRAKEG